MDKAFELKVTGDPSDLTFTAFLEIKRTSGPSYVMDTIDLYTVDKSKITSGSSLYYGCSGVSFSIDNVAESSMTFKGDSDPIGTVNLTFSIVKI